MSMASLKQSTTRFCKEVKVEMEKVSWPSRGEVRDMTIAVIVTTILVSLFVFVIDKGLELGMTLLLGWK